MEYTISAAEKRGINFHPEDVVEEILQNVWFLLNTLEYDCPLARGFGLSPKCIDRPMETAKALAVADIFDKVELYEPRAEVMKVEFESDHMNGSVRAKVEVRINGEYGCKEYTR